MSFDSAQLQIFVSLLLVLGALFVAFICDFLKGNNEVLRERNIELAVRQEERERLARISKPASDPKRRPSPEASSAPRPAKQGPAEAERPAPRPAPEEPIPKRVEVIPRRLIAAKVTPIDVFPSLVANPPEPAVEAPTAAQLHTGSSPEAAPAAPPPRQEPILAIAEPAGPSQNLSGEVSAEPSLPSGNAAFGLAPQDLSAEVPLQQAGDAAAFEPPSAPPAAFVSFPPGMHSAAALGELLEREEAFRGVVVAIGVTRGEPSGGHTGSGRDSVEALVESLLEARDAAFRTGENEFVLLLPDLSGAAAQRRLQHISEVLWDYQIRSMARSWMLFSWGSVEVDGEPLREALSAAKERMLQTKRHRERPAEEIHYYRDNHRAN